MIYPETILRSRITAVLMALLCLAPGLIGCGGGDDSPAAPSSTPVRLDPGATLLGAGWVNDWLWVPADLLREQICAMADNGWDAYLIEMGGAARWNGHTEAEARTALAERYPLLVQWCADEGLILLNSVQNDNAGQGKFGDQSPPLSGQVSFSAFLVNLIATVGRPDVVLVQPVAETQTAAGVDLERLCANNLSHFTLVNNAGSRPDTKPVWADYNATHPWTLSTIYSEDIIVGDTTPFIIQMDADGDMSGFTNPAMVQEAYDASRSAGSLLFGVYIFDAGPTPAVDYATLEGVQR